MPEELDISLIDTNPNQPRNFFDDTKIEALKKSIEKDGLLQPLIVRPTDGGRYELIAGECRFKALSALGRVKVPVVVKELSSEDALDLALLENELRTDLAPLEKAEAIKAYKERHHATDDQVAEVLGMQRTNVSNITCLNKLCESIKTEVRKDPKRYALRNMMSIARQSDEKKQKAAFAALKNRLAKKESGEACTIDKSKQTLQLASSNLKAVMKMEASEIEANEAVYDKFMDCLASTVEYLLTKNVNALTCQKLREALKQTLDTAL